MLFKKHPLCHAVYDNIPSTVGSLENGTLQEHGRRTLYGAKYN